MQDLLRPLTDLLPEAARPYWWIIPLLAVLLLLLFLLILISLIRRLLRPRPKPVPNPEHRLREVLANYPPAPGSPGSRRLTFEGLPVRLRLVVLAPVGKDASVEAAEAESILDQVVRGLGKAIAQDKARVRIWPAQLSSQGFSAVFHRLVQKPEPENRPSRWLLVAGQARINLQPVLIGLALWADQPALSGRRTFQPDEWTVRLRFENLEG